MPDSPKNPAQSASFVFYYLLDRIRQQHLVEDGKSKEKATAKPEREREIKTYIFKVAVEEDPFDDGKMTYHAYCPSLKGASTWDYTKEEVLKNIRKVVEMTVESMIEHGESIPEEPRVQVFSELRVAITI